MVASFKYTFKSLKNTKGFLSSMLIMPIIMVILITITLAYSDVPIVGVLKNEYKGDFNISNVRVLEIEKEDIDYFLGSMQGTLAVSLNDSGQIERYYSSVKNNPLIEIIENDEDGLAFKDKPKISYSLGIIIFKLLVAVSMTATFLIQERNNGIFIRLKNSKTTIFSHIFGKILASIFVYEIANIFIIAFYYFAGYDFGNTNVLDIFIIFTLSLIISSGIFVFFSSFMKNEGYLWVISTGVMFPLGLFSGILFPIEYMPNWMKFIGGLSPQYYLQKSLISGNIELIPISIFVLVSLILLVIGVKRYTLKE